MDCEERAYSGRRGGKQRSALNALGLRVVVPRLSRFRTSSAAQDLT